MASINNFHEYEKEDGSGYETVLEVKKYDCMSMTRKYDFIGIYTPQSGLGQDDASAVYVLNMDGGIQVITTDETGGTLKTGIYDLQGRKLSKEPTHGIYIKNGKKYVNLKSASNLNGNLNCSKELEHYSS